MNEWKYLENLRKKECHGIIVAVAIVAGVLALTAAILCIVKHCKSKSTGPFDWCDDDYDGECGCDCGCEDDDDDDDDDDLGGGNDNDPTDNKPSGGCDENGCCYTNDKDFV